jgi:hypothetical protein
MRREECHLNKRPIVFRNIKTQRKIYLFNLEPILLTLGKEGDIKYENIENREHQNGNIKKNRDIKNSNIEIKIGNGNIKNNTSIPVRLLGTGLGTIIIPQYQSYNTLLPVT